MRQMINEGRSIQNINEMDFRSDNYLLGDITSDRQVCEKDLRLRFWEIDDCFKCPVIGTCLDISEQKQILKKERISFKNKSDFEVHGTIVESSASENGLSHRIDSWFNRKFKKEIIAFSGLKEDEFVQLWKRRFEDGEIEGILWVAVTRTDLSDKTMRDIFGDIHMKMHLNARQKREKLQQLDFRRKENRELAEKLKEATKTKRTLTRENERLKKELSYTFQVSTLLEKKTQALELELAKLREESKVGSLLAENHKLQAETKTHQTELRPGMPHRYQNHMPLSLRFSPPEAPRGDIIPIPMQLP